jgi:hypothetical protein
MKIQLTLSAEQLELLSQSIVYSSLHDKLLKQDNPAWRELSAIILLADDEVNKGMNRQASYKLVK